MDIVAYIYNYWEMILIIFKKIHNFLSAQSMKEISLAIDSEGNSQHSVKLKKICVQYNNQVGMKVSGNGNHLDIESKSQILSFFGLTPTIRLSFIGEKNNIAKFKLKTYAVPMTEPILALLANLAFYIGGFAFAIATIKLFAGGLSSLVATSGQLFYFPFACWFAMLFFTGVIRIQKLIFSTQLKALIEYSKTNLTYGRLK